MKFTIEGSSDERYYIVSSSGINLTSHTSQPFFKSKSDAESYKKKFSHAPAIKSGKIVKGQSDKHGYVTEL